MKYVPPADARVHVDDDGNRMHADAEILEDYNSVSQLGKITNENKDNAVKIIKKYFSENNQLKDLNADNIQYKVLEFKNFVDREPNLVWRRMKELDLGLLDQFSERMALTEVSEDENASAALGRMNMHIPNNDFINRR